MAELREHWLFQTELLELDPDRLLRQVVGRQLDRRDIDLLVELGLTTQALAALTEGQSSWRPAELVRELAAATPTSTTVDAGELTRRLDALGDTVGLDRCVDISKPIPTGVDGGVMAGR